MFTQQQQQFLNQQHLQQQMIPVQEDFYLLDLVGGASQSCMHPTRPIVAYTSGCMIIVYDLITDQKINLVHHQHEVYALAFSPPGAGASQNGGEFLISVDFDRNDASSDNTSHSSTMCLWNWQRGQCLQEIRIPKSQNHNGSMIYHHSNSNKASLPKAIQIAFEKVGSIFFVLESFSTNFSAIDSSSGSGGYRATMWNLNRQQRIEMVNQLELELQNSCLGIQILPRSSYSTQSAVSSIQQSVNAPASHYSSQQQQQNKLRFITLERQAIKLWEYSQGHADLLKRIQIKQNMRQCVVADLTGYLLILGDNGKVLIINQEGEFISTIKKEMAFFTTISTAHDKLLLGTERGTICVYHLASLQFINEVPYQLNVLQNFQLNQSHQVQKRFTNQYEQDPSVFQLCPPVLQIATTHNMRFLYIKYQDQSFVVLDRTASQPSQAILGYQYGHFQKVTGLEWLPQNVQSKKKQMLLSANDNFFGTTGGTTMMNNHSNSPQQSSFITCAQDMSVFVWRHFGDRWSFSFIDVVKGCFDQSLSYQRKLIEKSTQNLELTSIKIYPKSPMVIIGDNKGIVRIFQVSTEKALFLASHELQRGYDLNAPTEDPIKDIYITSDELYAIVSFKSGFISCYDVRNGFSMLGIIEKTAQRFCYSNQLQVRMKIVENDNLSLNFSNLRIQDEKPLYSLYDNDILNPTHTSFQTNFRLLSTISPNCIQLQQIQIKGHKLTMTALSQFIIDEGKITGFDVHPSNDYLLVTSNQGRIYLYRIDTGELRGTIRIPLNAQECLIDPSGLYVMVQVPPFNPKHTANLLNNNIDDINTQLNQNQRDLERTTLLMFEVGTGKACAEIKSLFEVSSMAFSPDGKYISLGSRTGSVCVWALGEHLLQNIKQVLDAVKMQPDFWVNYPIFLEDYGTYGMAQTIPAQQLFSPFDNKQIDRPEDFVNGINNLGGKYDLLSDIGMLTSQRLPHQSAQNSTQGLYQQQPQLQQSPYQQQHNQQNIPYQQQQAYVKPPSNQRYVAQNNKLSMRDQHIQNSLSTNNNSIRKQSRSKERPLLQQQQSPNKVQLQNNNKFYRKTFVEDQQTQVTPQISGYLNNNGYQNQQVPVNQRIATAQVQTSHNNLPQIPDYNNVYNQQLLQQNPYQTQPNGISPQKQYNSTSSLISSPNRAELLYRDDIPLTIPNNLNNLNNFQDRQYPNQLIPQLNNNLNVNPITQVHPLVDNNNNTLTQQQRLRQDFIDRTNLNNSNVGGGTMGLSNGFNHNQFNQQQPLGYLNQQQQRNIFQEAEEQQNNNNVHNRQSGQKFHPQQQQQPIMTYEENLDAADLYNPLTLNQDVLTSNLKQRQTNLFATGQTIPIASINQSPIKQFVNTNTNNIQNQQQIGTTSINYGGGRLQSENKQQKRDLVKDPIDIDDDVSDNGPQSLENQLKELDGMNKYMHNIRIPTRFANDDFLVVNGRNAEQAYTLGRLRAEEKLISMDPPPLDNILEEDSQNPASTYDLVEEMYDNMDQFDQKIKLQKVQHTQPYQNSSYIYQ